MKFAETPGRVRALAMALLLATFTVGGLAGAAFDRVLGAEPGRAAGGDARCEPRRDRREGSTLERLDLSAEQRAQVDAVLERRRHEIEAFWQQEGSRLRALVDSTRAEIRSVLTPEQRETYDRLRAERKAQYRARHEEKRRNGNDDNGRDGR